MGHFSKDNPKSVLETLWQSNFITFQWDIYQKSWPGVFCPLFILAMLCQSYRRIGSMNRKIKCRWTLQKDQYKKND